MQAKVFIGQERAAYQALNRMQSQKRGENNRKAVTKATRARFSVPQQSSRRRRRATPATEVISLVRTGQRSAHEGAEEMGRGRSGPSPIRRKGCRHDKVAQNDGKVRASKSDMQRKMAYIRHFQEGSGSQERNSWSTSPAFGIVYGNKNRE